MVESSVDELAGLSPLRSAHQMVRAILLLLLSVQASIVLSVKKPEITSH